MLSITFRHTRHHNSDDDDDDDDNEDNDSVNLHATGLTQSHMTTNDPVTLTLTFDLVTFDK